MARLTAAERERMPKSEFAGKGMSFPVPDKKHARLAISGATRSEHAGNISPEEEARIKAKARKKLGKKRGGKADGKRAATRADKPRRARGGLTRAANVKGHESKPFTDIETDRRPGDTTGT